MSRYLHLGGEERDAMDRAAKVLRARGDAARKKDAEDAQRRHRERLRNVPEGGAEPTAPGPSAVRTQDDIDAERLGAVVARFDAAAGRRREHEGKWGLHGG